ncbi:glycosyltransferase family 4 protein [Isoalcanivorax indicus]|uniref:glycosyltransferase family 4 protein n=1 Tax=Isoalcanivorax indicus TaxID=2202653 RepID=UPI000DBA3577|nr:glycosyltransferase family 4 protein [Isoalcanivorax indicus]
MKIKVNSSIFIFSAHPRSLMNFRENLIKEFIDNGLIVHAMAPKIKESEAVRERLTDLGVRLHDLPLDRSGANPVYDFFAILVIFFTLLRYRPAAVFSYNIKPVVFGMMAAWLARVKVRAALITGLGHAFSSPASSRRSLVSRFASMLYWLGMRSASLVIFQNPDDKADLLSAGILPKHKHSIVVGGSGIDLDRFSGLPLEVNHKPATFLMLARLLSEKGVRDYAAAAAIVKKKLPSARFVLAGDFDENPDAISPAEVDDWVERGYIEYLGRIPDVRPALSECTAFVLPSYYREGIPRSILEAMAMSRAVVTTDSVGCREPVIHGETGYLVEPRNPEQLAVRLIELAENPELAGAFGLAGRKRAEEVYDVHKVNADMLEAMGLIEPNSSSGA